MWPWRKRPTPEPLSRVVDDRVFLLGLDELYRQAMKQHEAGELLGCARLVAQALGESPDGNAPVEGYYGESPELTEYLRLMRTLQRAEVSRRSKVEGMPQFQRLLAVATSPHLAAAFVHEGLLPLARDVVSIALHDIPPQQ